MTETSSTQTAYSGFGNLESYNKNTDFEEYLERMEFFFFINKIMEDRKKCAAFVTLAGRDVYQVLRKNISPRKVIDLTYSEIKDILKTKFAAKNTKIRARCEFYKRVQKDNETVATFAEELRALAQDCTFGDFLSDILRDRFICGIKNAIIMNKLIDDGDQTFEEALEKARNFEIVEHIARY